MKTSTRDGSNRGGGAGSRDRKTKRRRVIADPKALLKEVHGDEQASAAPKSSANDGSNGNPIVWASASEIDTILPKVTRGGFEQLVRRQLVEGIPITLADLTAAAKSTSKRKAESSSFSSSDTGQKLRKLISGATSVAKETRVINTEGWAGIPSDVMRDVLGRLNLRDKVVCVSKVCRAWNAFKTTPGLFVDLSDGSGPSSIKTLNKLVDWHPDLTAVTGLRIATTAGCLEECDMREFYHAVVSFKLAHRSTFSPREIAKKSNHVGQVGKVLVEDTDRPFQRIEKLELFGPAINLHFAPLGLMESALPSKLLELTVFQRNNFA